MRAQTLLQCALALLPLGACAGGVGDVRLRDEIAATTPVCLEGPDCDAQWRAARHWVRNDAGFSIRAAEDALIETYVGYPAQDPRLFVRVTKEAIGDGRARIVIAASCQYDYGCIPNRWRAELAFNRAVNAAHYPAIAAPR
jgi:hypothetical protein